MNRVRFPEVRFPEAGFAIRREKSYDLARTWRGETTVASFTFPFSFSPLPAIPTIAAFLDTALAIPPLRDNALSYTIESDTDPKLDRYRITVTLAGEPEREVSGTIDRTGFHEFPSALASGRRVGVRRTRSTGAAPRAMYPRVIMVAIPLAAVLVIVGALILLGAIITLVLTRGAKGAFNTLLLVGGAALIGFGIFSMRK